NDAGVQRRAEGVHAGQAVGAIDHRLMAEVAAGAAILLGDHGAQQPGLAGLGPDLARIDFLLVPLLEMRHELGLEESVGLLLEEGMLLRHPGRTRQIEGVHGRFPACRTTLAAPRAPRESVPDRRRSFRGACNASPESRGTFRVYFWIPDRRFATSGMTTPQP